MFLEQRKPPQVPAGVVYLQGLQQAFGRGFPLEQPLPPLPLLLGPPLVWLAEEVCLVASVLALPQHRQISLCSLQERIRILH